MKVINFYVRYQKKLLKFLLPTGNVIFNIFDPLENYSPHRLKVDFRHLKEPKFKHILEAQ